MISSIFSLREAGIKPTYLNPITETKLENNYYINNSLKFLSECQEELLICKQDIYKSLLESSDNPYILNESFNDIISKTKQIIKKILQYIESLVRKFITEIPKLVKSDKYIISKRKEIEKFPKDSSFTIEGYNFTIDENVPIVDIIGLDLSELSELMRSINKDNINSKIADIQSLITKLSDFNAMDSIRGEVLKVERNIPESSFSRELFSIFRDGKSAPEEITIEKEDVLRANKDFSDYDRQLKLVRRLQKDIDAKYKTLERQIEDIVKNNMTSNGTSKIDLYAEDLSRNIDILLARQIEQIRRISNIHVLALAAKLDAYNSLVLQDRNILYRAINIIEKNSMTESFKEPSVDYDYTLEGSYRSYVIDKYFINESQRYFVEECLALSESNIPELKAIHEDLKMNVQNWFKKLKNLVKSLLEKFLTKMNDFLKIDEKFLEKYKNVILSKTVEEYTLNDMPDYESGIENIKNHTFKNLNFRNLVSDDDKTIQQKLFDSYDGSGEFTEFVNRYFLCNNDKKVKPRDIKSSELKMSEIYTFCVSAKDSIKKIQTGFNTFYAENDKVANEVVRNMKNVKEFTDLTGEKYYYSTVLEAFINEEGEAKDNIDLNVDAKPNKNDNLEDKTSHKTEDDLKNAETQTKENDNTDYKKLQDAGKTYLNTIKTINLAKITAFQKIYKEYMKILRYHVKKASGNDGNATFTDEDKTQLKAAMKDYRDDKNKDAAAQKIINIYKSKNMEIDARDVQNLVNKNANALG